MDEDKLKELDEMVKSGEVRASCPSCYMFLNSVFVKKCPNCKNKIDMDKILLKEVDWSMAN